MDTNIDSNYNINDVLSFSKLPRELPIKKLGRQYKKLEGYVKMNSLSRVKALLADTSSQLEEESFIVSLSFTRIANSKVLIEGTINQELTMICQRCYNNMPYTLDTSLNLIVAENIDKNDKRFSQYEVILIENNLTLDLYQVIEDEMILALPIVVKHGDEDRECSKNSSFII